MREPDEDLVELARDEGPDGTTLLRERHEGSTVVHELVVDGVFAMDSRETASERALAALVPERPGARVLVGGLGLGYTAAAVLDRSPAAAHVDVVELAAPLVAWARRGVTPLLRRVANDPRCRLVVADVARVLAGEVAEVAGPWDAVLLDVDNGPDFLVHPANAGLYAPESLAPAFGRLAPGGVLAVWCQGAAPELLARLRALDPAARAVEHPVQREGRRFSYVICVVTAPDQWTQR